MPATTPRLALPYGLPNDPPDGAAQVKALAEKLDPITPTDAQGTLAARPAASTAGRYYFATDEHKLYRDNGTGWEYVAAGSPTAVWTTSDGAPRTLVSASVGVVGLGGGSPYTAVAISHGLASANLAVMGGIDSGGNAAYITWAWAAIDANQINIHFRNLNPGTPFTGGWHGYIARA